MTAHLSWCNAWERINDSNGVLKVFQRMNNTVIIITRIRKNNEIKIRKSKQMNFIFGNLPLRMEGFIVWECIANSLPRN